MRMVILRYGIEIIPDNPLDEAFIEEVLKLRKVGDTVALKRENVIGLDCIAYLKTEVKVA